MARFLKSFILIATAAITFSSCQKEAEATEIKESARLTIHANVNKLANEDTKTYLGDDGKTVLWGEGEYMTAALVGGGKFDTYISKVLDDRYIGENQADFEFEVTLQAGNPYLYGGVYPSSAVVPESNTEAKAFKIKLKDLQEATAFEYDPSAYILIAKPTEFKTAAADWVATFRRATALNKITLTNLADDIVSVTITVPEGKDFAGERKVDLTTGESGTIYGGTNTITVDYATPLASSAPKDIWFTSWDVVVPEGSILTVAAYSKDYSYTRTITARAGGISFKEGFLNTLSINMESAEREPLDPEILHEFSIKATYDITSTSPVQILGASFAQFGKINKMEVDDVEVSPSLTYQFPRVGTHTVRYYFDKNATSLSGMFNGITTLKRCEFLDTDEWNILSFRIMFQGCTSLQSLAGYQELDTSNVQDFTAMFNRCSSLVSLDLSAWNTAEVKNMQGMFISCTSLKEVGDLSNWDTKNVTSTYMMFANCSALSAVGNLRDWNMQNNTNMCAMFQKCSSLTSLDLSNWNTMNVTDMSYFFTQCENLATVGDLSNWNVAKVNAMNAMFYGCRKLRTLGDISKWNGVSVTESEIMFNTCSFLDIIVPGIHTLGGDSFTHCAYQSRKEIYFPATVKKVRGAHLFYNCGRIEKFVVDPASTSLKSWNGILMSYDGTTVYSVPNYLAVENNTLELPEGITKLAELSFQTLHNADTLVLPDSYVVTEWTIGGDTGEGHNDGNSIGTALYCNTRIKSYQVKESNPNYISNEGCLYSKDGKRLVAVPHNYEGDVSILEGCTTIERDAFYANSIASGYPGLPKTTSIHFPASVTSIHQDQITFLNKVVDKGTLTVTIDAENPVYTVTGGKILTK